MIVREREFVLFIDELNIASQEIQKAFYSLILDKRIGEYRLPAGSIIIGAGNRAQDAALAKPMPSALVNRMVHVHLKASHREWLQWAETHAIHPWVLDYVRSRPTQLATDVPPAREEPFSTPRSWHGVSDALHSFGDDIAADHLDALLFGSLTRDHAVGFKAFLKQIRNKFSVHKILKGEEAWPSAAEDRDLTYFLTQSLRDLLVKELPAQDAGLGRDSRELAQQARSALKALARIDGELAQLVLTESDAGDRVPDWFVLEIARSCRGCCRSGPAMDKSSRGLRKKRPFEEAFAELRRHDLLGSVAEEMTVRPAPPWRDRMAPRRAAAHRMRRDARRQ